MKRKIHDNENNINDDGISIRTKNEDNYDDSLKIDLENNLEIRSILENIITKIEEIPSIYNLFSLYELSQPILPNYFGLFNASEIASLIGKHSFITKTQSLYNLLLKNIKFKNLIDKLNYKLKLNNRLEIVKNSLNKLNSDIKRIANSSSELYVDNLDDLSKYIKSNIKQALENNHIFDSNEFLNDNFLKNKLELEFQSEIFKKRGINLETKAINELEIEKNIKITNRNNKLYEYKSKFYKIKGQIDGFDKNENCIIEIKNRINKKDFIPAYEFIQCLAYMKLANNKKCYLVECFADNSKKQTLIEWEQDCYNEIHSKLNELVMHIRNMTIKDVYDLILKYNEEYLKSIQFK